MLGHFQGITSFLIFDRNHKFAFYSQIHWKFSLRVLLSYFLYLRMGNAGFHSVTKLMSTLLYDEHSVVYVNLDHMNDRYWIWIAKEIVHILVLVS